MTQPWLTNPTEADLAAAVEENLFALFRAMRAIPGCEVVESERLCTHHAFLDNPFFKGVWQARLDPGEVGPAIDSAIAWFKQRRAKDFLWWTGPQTRPLDFVERLLRRGFDGNYEWILQTFTVSNRAQSLYCMAPYLSSIVEPGDDVLDLCCGSGSMSFWFEERGARVTGIDFAPYMIALAREEASRRNSLVEFIQADIFAHDLEQGRYNLVSCFGNSISDFPLSQYAEMVRRVASALKPNGRFVLQYHDGSYKYIQGNGARSGVYQETPERITFRFKEYLPEIGACVNTIRNETRGEEYDRKGYIYTVPVVQLIMGNSLALEQHILLEEHHYLDVFTKE